MHAVQSSHEVALETPTAAEAAQYTQAIIAAASVEKPQPNYFQSQRIGSFRLRFEVDGEAVKAKKSDGYVSLKLRHRDRLEVGYFVIDSDTAMPSRRALHQQIEQFYSRQKDVRVKQVHLEANLDDR